VVGGKYIYFMIYYYCELIHIVIKADITNNIKAKLF